MFTNKHSDVDIEGQKQETNPNTSSHQLEPLDLSKTSSFRYSLPINEESQGRQQEEIFNTESIDSTYFSLFRCILKEEDPHPDNPDLYDYRTCRKRLNHMRSRRLFPEADHCDKLSFENRDLVTNQENHECYDPRTQEASLASSTVKTIFSAVKHLSIDNPSVKFDDQERSDTCHLQDGFTKVNLSDENERRPVCPVRQEGFRNLTITQQTKSKTEYPLKCDRCPRKYACKINLEQHNVLVHGAQPKFHCHFCSKGFVVNSKLENHMKVHESNVDVKCPFKCDKCPRQYSRKINLEQHILDHGGQPKFICDFCSKGFMANSSLKRHLKVHKNNVDANFNSNASNVQNRL